MANFKNFTKLQIIVERTDLGDDSNVGGDLIYTVSITGAAIAGETLEILGVPVTTVALDSATVVASKAAIAIDVVTGLTATSLAGVLTVTLDNTFVGSDPTFITPTVSDGVTYVYTSVDNRDSTSILKHSEYEDTETGLILATSAMYTLVAASAVTDVAQLQRIMLSSSDTELITTDITAQVVGKDYTSYTA